MKLSVIQMVSTADVSQNLAEVSRLCEQLSRQAPDVVLLPENFALFYTEKLFSLAQKEDKEQWIVQHLASLAKQYKFAIIAGSLPLLSSGQGIPCDSGKVRSASLFIDDRGEILARYDKIHLFDVDVDDAQGTYQESSYIEPGDQLVVVSYKGVCFGLSICYDLRFPYLFQALAERGADVICVPSAFTQVTGQAHWRVLLQARAIENQCYILGANQGGNHGEGRATYGHSMIVNPWGEVLEEIKEGAGIITASFDAQYIKKIRAKMPILKHRKDLSNDI